MKWSLNPISLFAIAVFLFTSLGKSYSQGYITGKVVSQSYSVPYATVKLFNDSILLKQVSCDSLGNFKIPLQGLQLGAVNKNILTAFFLQSKSAAIILKDINIPVTLQLDLSDQILSSITVTADKNIFIRKEDRFVFTPGKLTSIGSNALDMMKHVPLIAYDNRTDMFSIIGRPGTIVYINNRKTILPAEMLLSMLRSLRAEDIKSIEIITNPGSEYAANTSAGIININLKRPPSDGWMGSIQVANEQSAYNTTIFNGAINYRSGKLAMLVSPFFNNSFNYNTSLRNIDYKTGVTNVLNSDYFRRYQVYGGGLNIDYNINNKHFISYNGWLSAVNGKSTRSTDTYFSSFPISINDSIKNTIEKGTDHFTYNFGNINYHFNIDSQSKSYLDFNIDYNLSNQQRNADGTFNDVDLTEKKLLPNGFYTSIYPQQLFNLSERLEYYTRLKNNFTLSIGIQRSDSKVKSNTRFNTIDHSSLISDSSLSKNYTYKEIYDAAFLSISKKISAKLSTKLGLRAERTNYSVSVINQDISVDSSYTNLFPSISFNYLLNKRNQLALSFSRKIKRPAIELLLPGRTYSNNAFFSENNPYLQPSLSYNTELSYILNNKLTLLLNHQYVQNGYLPAIISIYEDGIAKLKNTYINCETSNTVSLTVNYNQALFKENWYLNVSPLINYVSSNGILNSMTANVRNLNYSVLFDNTVMLSSKQNIIGVATFKYNSPREILGTKILNATSSLDLGIRKLLWKKLMLSAYITDLYNGSSILKTRQANTILLSANTYENNTYRRTFSLQAKYVFGNRKINKSKERNTANQDIRNRAN